MVEYFIFVYIYVKSWKSRYSQKSQIKDKKEKGCYLVS